MRLRYDIYDVGDIKLVLSIRYDYGILPMHCTSIALDCLWYGMTYVSSQMCMMNFKLDKCMVWTK